MWCSRVITLFPEMFPGPLGVSLTGQALRDGIWSLETVNVREYGIGLHKSVDAPPFGGGPGMIIRPDVLDPALRKARKNLTKAPLIVTSPRGHRLDQNRVKKLVAGPGVVLLCGRFEGIDQRLIDAYRIEEISLGDFILSSGEPAAIALLDACVRLLPNVMGKFESTLDESFENGLLEYPQYTRPQMWANRKVPGILLSGHHEKIKNWRLDQSKAITERRRPDLWSIYQRENS
ncbi:MAG: tRNA (guanosine(37)-N1)-methyltransferase TrmD [Rhodospirillaceae bacterium TMED8]|nr:tRNA (guanosine(37)-N1)-methyltransferase TrmD [Magnetovibrio sp.]OUT48611.1 MAG: tRNA (guanosine(37)-N1)-methyltransferase TrmD [Rhodospirillaceae bacterium TMED8]